MTYTAYITGDTYEFRKILQGGGYSWDPQRKAWGIEYEAMVTAEEAVRDVRRLGGIRNRGHFQAEIVSS